MVALNNNINGRYRVRAVVDQRCGGLDALSRDWLAFDRLDEALNAATGLSHRFGYAGAVQDTHKRLIDTPTGVTDYKGNVPAAVRFASAIAEIADALDDISDRLKRSQS